MSIKGDYSRKATVIIALSLIAVLPVFVGIVQCCHYLYWLNGLDYESTWVFYILRFTAVPLMFSFIISIYERFCIYHRITIIATFYATSSCFFLDLYPSILFYNATNLCAVLCIIAGILGCSYHFLLQINDFRRYVRIKSAQ